MQVSPYFWTFPHEFPCFQKLLSNKFYIVTCNFNPTFKLLTSVMKKPTFETNLVKTGAGYL